MTGTRVLHSGITGPCCSSKQFGGLPSSPSWPDHRHQLPAPKGTARRPRGTVRRRTADGMALRLFGIARCRAEQTWTGATASHGRGSTAHGRARVSESCCRDRWFEVAAQRSAEVAHSPSGRHPLRGRELDLEVAISDFLVARRVGPSASSDRAMFHRTNPLQLVGLAGRFRMVSNRDR